MSLDIKPFPTIETQAGINLATRENGFVIEIDTVSVGDGLWTPGRNATALKNEIARVGVSRAKICKKEGSISTQFLITAPRAFNLREIGFWSGDTLVYVGVNQDGVDYARLATGMTVGLEHKHHLSFLPAEQITVNCTGPDMNIVFDAEFGAQMALNMRLAAMVTAQSAEIEELRRTLQALGDLPARLAHAEQEIRQIKQTRAHNLGAQMALNAQFGAQILEKST